MAVLFLWAVLGELQK